MTTDILAWFASLVITLIQSTGYVGIFILMMLESANIPIPSEIIMPFSGFLVAKGALGFWWVTLVGTLGNVFGSIISYLLASYIVRYRHKIFFLKVLISDDFLAKSSKFFDKYGSVSVFFSRMLPILRTFISLPAGIGKMKFSKFVCLTFLGSFIWSVVLTYFGKVLGDNWNVLEKYFRQFDLIIVAIILALGVYWMTHHFRGRPR
jgi:membrane protein DedA with SNARE-associated domain